MKRCTAVVVLLAALAMYGGWRSVAHALADGLATKAPEQALRWVSGHPEAWLAIARNRAAQGDVEGAAARARAVLEREPLLGEAWRWLGAASDAAGDRVAARTHYAEAVRLAPRDTLSRRWLARDALQRGDARAALVQLDGILRSDPASRGAVLSALVQLSAEPGFRAELVAALAQSPGWRGGFLRRLQAEGVPTSVDAVYAALQREGALADTERAQWLDGMLRRQDWPQAYARWAATVPDGMRLQPVYNGDFSRRPDGEGFNWRSTAKAGTSLGFPGSGGARLDYRNRRVDLAGLEQALLLPVGRHRLVARMRARDLRAEHGLQWVVTCAGAGRNVVLGQTPPIRGDRDWHDVTAEIEIPEHCPGQWLRLRNATRTAALQRVSGTLEIASVAIEPVHE